MMKNKHELHEKYGTAKAWYTSNESIRDTLEGEWREASQLTLPYVFPVEDQDESALLPTPYNSIGPNAVNTLASKLLLALLPPTGVFFRLLPDNELLKETPEKDIKRLDGELAQVEQDVVEYINQKAIRVPIYEAIKLLIITGNVMVYASATDDSGVKGMLEVFVSFPEGISQHNVDALKVYPNPAVNELNVVLTKVNTVVSIYNSVGQKMDEVNVAGLEHRFDISSYAKGIYFVKTDDSVAKFIK